METISIVIPVYNISAAKRQFLKALDSVLSQTYKNLEVIIVNDGSTDGTAQILFEQSMKDSRIRVISKENGGVESARRRGIAEARGEYIFHLDQDDLLTKDALKTLHTAAVKYGADVVIGQSKHFYLIPAIGKAPKPNEDIIMNQEQFMNQFYHGFFGQSIFPVQIWNKLYKKSFLDSIPDPPCVGKYHEDLNYNLHVLPNAECIVWLSKLTHYYRWGGFTTRPIKDLEQVALSCYRIKMNKIAEMGLQSFEYSTAVELLNYINSYFYQICKYDGPGALKVRLLPVMNLDEVQEAMQTVQKGNYRNEHINYMLNHDYEELINYEMRQIHKNRNIDRVKKVASYLS